MRIVTTKILGDVISLVCDCGGKIEPYGKALDKYKHICIKCKKEYLLEREYPYFANFRSVYEEMDDGR